MSVEEHFRGKDLVPPDIDGPSDDCPAIPSGVLSKSGTRNASGTGICFNKHMVKFLKTLLASGFQKYFIVSINRLGGKHATLTQGGTTSTSADITSTKAMGKVLRKYNKVLEFYNISFYSMEMLANTCLAMKVNCFYIPNFPYFRIASKVLGSVNSLKCSTECQNAQLEDLKPPCLCELMAFHMNVKERKNKTTIPGLLDDCKLETSEGRSSISVTLSNSRVLAVDLTCSICLETFFDPVSLTCSHMFCYMCACCAGSVSTIHGITAADSKSKCPLCRKKGVFRGAVRMSQLNTLLRRKFPEYWEERRQKERQARLQEAKEYWQLQCRTFVGIN